jgi:YggT family protein
MEAVNYLLKFIFDALLMVLILRVWLQWVRADFYNPFSQFIVKVTNPLVVPARRMIPGFGGLDLATVIVAYFVVTVKFIVIPLLNGGHIDLIASLYFGLLSLVKQTGVLLFMIMLIMAIMSWVVQGYNQTLVIFHQLTEPFLKPIRRMIPAIGGIDLSVLIAFLLLNVLNILLSGIVPYWAML